MILLIGSVPDCNPDSRQGQRMKEIVIPQENAVFWLDRHGCWRNVHGKFRNKKIIDHFNRSIRRDAGGYFVTQINGDVLEKVYFRCEDTALFVTEISPDGDEIRLALNTGDSVMLDPDALRVKADQLYLVRDGERIRFTERALMRFAAFLDCESERYFFTSGGLRLEIPPLDTPEAS